MTALLAIVILAQILDGWTTYQIRDGAMGHVSRPGAGERRQRALFYLGILVNNVRVLRRLSSGA